MATWKSKLASSAASDCIRGDVEVNESRVGEHFATVPISNNRYRQNRYLLTPGTCYHPCTKLARGTIGYRWRKVKKLKIKNQPQTR